jgi:hypothetical protein
MKDIIIKGSAIRRELLLLAALLVAAQLVNIGAIIGYGGQWRELWTQWHVVLALGLVFYLVPACARACIAGLRCLLRRNADG